MKVRSQLASKNIELSNKINNTLTECLQLIERVSENDNLPKLCQVLRFLNTFLKYSFGETTSV